MKDPAADMRNSYEKLQGGGDAYVSDYWGPSLSSGHLCDLAGAGAEAF